MIPTTTIIVWLIILNLAAIALFLWTLVRLPWTRARSSFLFFLFGYLLWLNPLLFIQLVDPASAASRFIAQSILAGGCVFVGSLGHFIILFAAPHELQRLRYKLFQANFGMLFVLSFTGFLSGGAQRTANGLAPMKGPLQPYFDLSMVAFGVYFLTVCAAAYRNTKSDLLKSQLRTVFWTCLPSFGIGLTTNAIIPGVSGNFQLTPTGGLWLLLFFAGIAHILANGTFLLVKDSLKVLCDEPAMRDPRNVLAVNALLQSVVRLVENDGERTVKRVPFTLNDGSGKELVVTRDSIAEDQADPEASLSIEKLSHSPSAARTLLERRARIIENMRLSSSLHSIQGALKIGLQSEIIGAAGGSDGLVDLAAANELLDVVVRRSVERFGLPIIDISEPVTALMDELVRAQRHWDPLVFEGETGVGKAFFAKALHQMRGGRNLLEVSCLGINMTEVEQLLFDLPDQQRPYDGILLRHLDTLPVSEFVNGWSAIQSRIASAIPCYGTIAPRSLTVKPLLERFFRAKTEQVIRVPSLRERQPDVFYLLLLFLQETSLKLGLSLEAVNETVFMDAGQYTWRGNARELRNEIIHGLVYSANTKVFTWPLMIKASEMSSALELTPLMEGEKAEVPKS